MRIFLIGMMGAGKTTIGKQLAERIGVPFVDLDVYIEKSEQNTVSAIFAQQGADRFRELERRALEVVAQNYTTFVVATGGGTPCYNNNIDFMKMRGTCVFLDIPEEEILRRLETTDLSSRPLLANKTAAERKHFIAITLEHRRPIYEQADAIVKSADNTLNELLTLLNYK